MLTKIFNKKNLSNIVFVIAVALMVYSPTREWIMRQVAFAPSVDAVEERDLVTNYNWNLTGLNAENLNFNDVKGKVVFINFWATWCPPCRAELPMIQKLYDDYKDKIIFIFVTNEEWDTVEQFFNENGYSLPVYNSITTPPNNFTKTNSIPASYLLDKKGSILISKVGAANWNSSKIRNLLDELLK